MENYPGLRNDGRKKWNSAFILPEHRKRIAEFYLSQNDIPQPYLSSDELEELNYAVHQYLEERCMIELAYYRQKAVHRIKGTLIECDLIKRILTLMDLNEGMNYFPMRDILSIEKH
ncbi:YolD-like family protein [Paenibacillus terrae]|uniref:YolD-like family protein n=1 Tax=Paenibacillus terrae TaxID=159743 RepID=A0A0D7WWQ4_9BACL|nr:YolD-like family protein [Paenibacillus terrae]KJD43616.1 hypothetical protein QD47_21740 [Paenibacillus terrae]